MPLHQSLLDAGIAIAGIDVGESYGSPHAFKFFDALYAEMKSRGYSSRPVLLGRSRGGLTVSSWAIAHPDRVKAIAGIYPVFDWLTYPTIDRVVPAYGLDRQSLLDRQSEFNPIARGGVLANAKIPIFLIHGEDDRVVPLAENSGKLESIYAEAGEADRLTLKRIPDQGHNLWPGFFKSDELMEFVIKQSRNP